MGVLALEDNKVTNIHIGKSNWERGKIGRCPLGEKQRERGTVEGGNVKEK
jgi:hypothetical protein